MNRGVVERSPVQQMTTAAVAGNSNRWSMSNMISSRPTSAQIVTSFSAPPPPPTDVLLPRYTALPPPSSTTFWVDDNQQLPAAESISWSQLLLGGLVEENDNRKSSELTNLVQTKKAVENWEDVFLHQQQSNGYLSDARQLGGYSTNLKSFFMYSHENINEEYQTSPLKSSWLPPAPVSPPASCVTTLNSSNHLSVDLTGKMSDGRRPPLDHSSECNSTGATAGANKKARVQPSSTQSTFKVRKEKLGDRITALHQLVSPFGKTDTASVLLEAIGYIRFLQSQVEALSVPYMGKTSSGLRQQQNVRKTDRCEIPKKDLKSRGLCLVPISSTLQVGNDINGADYWAPALGGSGGGFR